MIKFKHKMDATSSFGVTTVSEVPSNPQLTLDPKSMTIFFCSDISLHENRVASLVFHRRQWKEENRRYRGPRLKMAQIDSLRCYHAVSRRSAGVKCEAVLVYFIEILLLLRPFLAIRLLSIIR